MADNTTTPITEESTQQALNFAASIATAGQNLEQVNGVVSASNKIFGAFNSVIEASKINLNSIGDASSQDAIKFGFLTTALIGTSDAFKTFGANIDTSRLNTFTSQVSQLFEILSRPGTTGAALNSGLKSVIGIIEKFDPTGAAKLIGKSADVVKSYAMQVFAAADNQIKLQNSMLQMATQSGNLGDFYAKIGDNMERLNQVSAQQTTVLTNASKATGLQVETLAAYAGELSAIPKSLDQMLNTQSNASSSTNIFTQTVLFAIGAGRQYKDVASDMKKATVEYGLGLQDSLKYVSRMTEVSGLLGAQIEDVRSALNSSAEAFKMFTTQGDGAKALTQGMSDAMLQYVDSLKTAGVSTQNAIQMWSQMSSAMSGMRTEQKAFLSAQTGGPGGLMGAFQIDKMIKDGDIKGVYDKIQTQIKKQLGSIVTVDEAATSERAARQMQKQMLILQSGPLGHLAKGPVEAQRLLESLKMGQMPGAGKDITADKRDQFSLDATMKKGTEFSGKTYTEITKIRSVLEEMSFGAGSPVLTGLQRATTESVGDKSNGKDAALTAYRNSGMRGDTNILSQQRGIDDFKTLAESIPASMKRALEGFKDILSTGNMAEASNKFDNDIKAQKEANKIDTNITDEARKENDKKLDIAQKQKDQMLKNYNENLSTQMKFTATEEDPSAARPVARAAARASDTQARAAAENTTHTGTTPSRAGPTSVKLVDSTITVNVASTCPHCNQSYSSTGQQVVAPATSSK